VGEGENSSSPRRIFKGTFEGRKSSSMRNSTTQNNCRGGNIYMVGKRERCIIPAEERGFVRWKKKTT